jgi:hypothetical protein
MQALHPTKYNTGNTTGLIISLLLPTPKSGNQAATNEGCRRWNGCYECNNSITLLLFNKAE